MYVIHIEMIMHLTSILNVYDIQGEFSELPGIVFPSIYDIIKRCSKLC